MDYQKQAKIGADFYEFFHKNRDLWETIYSEHKRLEKIYRNKHKLTIAQLESAKDAYFAQNNKED